MNKNIIIISAVAVIVLLTIIAVIYFFIPKNMNTAPTPNENQQVNLKNFEIQGMKVEILQEGTGKTAKSGSRITVNYVGTLEDGVKFDSSIDRGQPFTFTLGLNSVIRGWELGVVGMKVGEKRKLIIPPKLAYGEQGAGGVIPPNATLIFEIDLLEIKQ